jgi:replicative DNA helicase
VLQPQGARQFCTVYTEEDTTVSEAVNASSNGSSATDLQWKAGGLLVSGDPNGAAALIERAKEAEADEELAKLGVTREDVTERQRREEAERTKRDNALAASGIIPEPRDVVIIDRGEPVRTLTDRVVSLASFVLDDPNIDVAPRWGDRGGQIVWARGEPFLIVGPTGVGKTTVAAQLLGALLGITDNVLGLRVEPCERPLYFALDRPKQIQRAMRRSFGEQHRDALQHRQPAVWRGPLPADVGKHPELLCEIATEAKADVVLLDSLKDLTAKVSDDEHGSNINHALQMLVAEDIDVLALHHQRKGQNGARPKTLEDVYGSTWITAGAGSVVLLWGEAGSELIELEHLKQPADPIGPWQLEHDHHAGTTTVTRGFDVLAYLRHRAAGATLDEVAQAEHGTTASAAQRKKTERRLRALQNRTPPLVGTIQGTSSGGRFGAALWVAVDTTVDTPPEVF